MLSRIAGHVARLRGGTPGDHALLCHGLDWTSQMTFLQRVGARGDDPDHAREATSDLLAWRCATLIDVEEWASARTPLPPGVRAETTSDRTYPDRRRPVASASGGSAVRIDFDGGGD